jgi:hypothetical protein
VNLTDVEQPQVRNTIPKLHDVIAAARQNLCDAESQELEELLTEYRDTLAIKSDDYQEADRVYRRINTGEA